MYILITNLIYKIINYNSLYIFVNSIKMPAYNQNKSNKNKINPKSKTIIKKSHNKKQYMTDIDQISSLVTHTQINDPLKNAIIYTRCSTPKQNTDRNQSLDTQEGICRVYASRLNLTVVKVIRDIIPGHNCTLQSYNQILDSYSNTHVIIADPSRLSRNVSDANTFLQQCTRLNITVHFARDNYQSDSLHDQKRIINSVCDAYIESKVLSKRIKSAISFRKELGSHIGNAPYGYTISYQIDQTSRIRLRKLQPQSYEQKVIELIMKLYYGSDIKEFYKVFRIITKNKSFKLFDSNNEEFTDIYYGNIGPQTIASFLNEHSIKYKNKIWTSQIVSRLISQYKSKNVPYYDPSYIFYD
jgi:DNA invertase Pin-like site-specific DNA recombinase